MQISFQCKLIIKLVFFILPFAVIAETEYEPNNTLEDARPIFVNDFPQVHKFDYSGDEDWLVFYAQKGTPYDIKIESEVVGQGIDPALELYNESGEIELGLFNGAFEGGDELRSWDAPASGFYYIRVINLETGFNIGSDYKINVFLPEAPNAGRIKGKVIDQCSQIGIKKAKLSNNVVSVPDFSFKTGRFSIILQPGTYEITAQATGYLEQIKTATVAEHEDTPMQFDLLPEAGCTVTPTPDPDATPIDSTPAPGELEQLKQQAVAVYDDSSRVLTVKDVRVGGDILAVSLKAQNDFSFILTSVTHLGNGVSSKPAFYNFDNLLGDIPQVFAFDQLFSVQLRRLSVDGAFVIQIADPLAK